MPAPALPLPLPVPCPAETLGSSPSAAETEPGRTCLGFVKGSKEEEGDGSGASRAGLSEGAPGKGCLDLGFGGT